MMSMLISAMLVKGQAPYAYSTPVGLTDGWKTGNLIELGLDSSRVYALFDQLSQNDHDMHSVLVVKNGTLLLEEYFGSFSAADPHDLRSATKSIISLLMGIAIDKGMVEDIDDPIFKYLPGNPGKNEDPRKAKITIRHLLTMSAGLDCDDWNSQSKGQEDKVYRKRDWIQYTLDLPMVNDPGAVSTYCSMGVVLAAEIIAQASGIGIDEFADRYLFRPLGIDQVAWGHTSNREVISSGKRLYMRPRDMAKIGQLVLDNGEWQGRQLVSKAWLESTTTKQTKLGGVDYGFLWWQIPIRSGGDAIVSKTATGNGGQYIMVFDDADLVVVFTGGAYNSAEDKLPFAIVRDVVLPTFLP